MTFGAVARHLGHQDLFDGLVAPWRDHGGPTGFPSNRAAAVGTPTVPTGEPTEGSDAPKAEETSSGAQLVSGASHLSELTSVVNRINDTLVQFMADCKSGGGQECPPPDHSEQPR